MELWVISNKCHSFLAGFIDTSAWCFATHQVLQSRTLLRSNKLLGSFKLDVGTVYSTAGNQGECPCVSSTSHMVITWLGHMGITWPASAVVMSHTLPFVQENEAIHWMPLRHRSIIFVLEILQYFFQYCKTVYSSLSYLYHIMYNNSLSLSLT